MLCTHARPHSPLPPRSLPLPRRTPLLLAAALALLVFAAPRRAAAEGPSAAATAKSWWAPEPAATPASGSDSDSDSGSGSGSGSDSVSASDSVTTQSLGAPPFPLAAPQLVRANDGVVLAAPRLQLLPVGSAPLAVALQGFVEAWRDSRAWPAMTAEYGVGPLTVLPRRTLASPFVGTVLDVDDDAGELGPSAIETLLASALGAEADANTVYVVLLPEGIPASLSPEVPDACAAHVWAWHSASALRVGGREVVVPYVVLPACAATGAMGALDRKTAALSHAVVQAVTNPTGRGYAGTNADHVAHELASGDGELGSLCTQALWRSGSWSTKSAELPYAVARVWSNAESRAGRLPCAPASVADADYVRAELELCDTVDAALDGGTRAVPTRGVALAPGAETSVRVHLTAQGRDAGAVTLEVQEVGTDELTLALERAVGRAGDVVGLRVRLAPDPEHAQHLVRVTVRRGDNAFSTYFLVRPVEAL